MVVSLWRTVLTAASRCKDGLLHASLWRCQKGQYSNHDFMSNILCRYHIDEYIIESMT